MCKHGEHRYPPNYLLNRRMFHYVDSLYNSDEYLLDLVKGWHREGADANPFNKDRRITLMEAAQRRGFKKLVAYLKLRVEFEARFAVREE